MPTSTFSYNQDYQTRDRLIFGSVHDYSDRNELSINYFYDLDLKTLQKLISLKFADPEQCENTGFSIEEAIELGQEWLEDYPMLIIKFGGYTVSPKRDDYRVSINRIEAQIGFSGDREFLLDLLNFISNYEMTDINATSSSVSFSWD